MQLRSIRVALAALTIALSFANAAHAQAQSAHDENAVAPRRTNVYANAWRNYLAQQRTLQIQRLEAYARAENFPSNRVQLGYTNLWRDDNGRYCAMANLVRVSGNETLANQQAIDNNRIRFADALLSNHPLLQWLRTSGLTLEEAVLIQEPYAFDDGNDPSFENEQKERLRADYLRTAQRLRATTARSLNLAVQRLGTLVMTPPPA